VNTSKLSPKVALLNFNATLGENYNAVIQSIFDYCKTTNNFRANSTEILGKSYIVSKAINTSLIDFNDTKLNLFLGTHVPKFIDKPNVWFIYNQTDACVLYFSDTLSRVDNALFDILVRRTEVGYQDNGMFSAEYMEVISNLDNKSYTAKYNEGTLDWQAPQVQQQIVVQPNVQVPASPSVQPTNTQPSKPEVDVNTIVAEVLKALGKQ
tara:strand:+ start:105 stop:731 length:627 start_codon:yes stop_codon:yes gene_type:complete